MLDTRISYKQADIGNFFKQMLRSSSSIKLVPNPTRATKSTGMDRMTPHLEISEECCVIAQDSETAKPKALN